MKSLIRYILIPAFALCAKAGSAQYWDSLGSGINGSVAWIRALYGDSAAQKLYVGGYFYAAGGVAANYVASWDGTSWDSLGPGITDQAFAFEKYNNKLFVGGVFRSVGSDFRYRSLATWDGSQWDSLPGIPPFPDNPTIWCLKEYNNELYVGGSFDSIGGMNNLPSILKWNGTNWINLNLPIINHTTSFFVNAIEFYQGKMFVGGNFSLATSIDTMSYLFMWDGVNVSQVGTGFYGSMTGITSMAVYNGELYIGGVFTIADGNAGNHICKWDGTTLTEVGGGLSNWVNQLKVINNELYAVGVFAYAGNVLVNGIAKWDGQKWCALEGVFDEVISAITDLNNEIYLGGGFQMIDSDSLSRIAKWIGGNYTDTCSVPTGINDAEINSSGELLIYPNPAQDELNLSFSLENSALLTINMHDALGRTVSSAKLQGNKGINKISVSLTSVADGIYFVELKAKNFIKGKKVVIAR